MTSEMGITLVIAVLGVLNVLGVAGLWFRLGSLTEGQEWIVDTMDRLDNRIIKLETRLGDLEEDFNVFTSNSGVNSSNNRESYPRHKGKG